MGPASRPFSWAAAVGGGIEGALIWTPVKGGYIGGGNELGPFRFGVNRFRVGLGKIFGGKGWKWQARVLLDNAGRCDEAEREFLTAIDAGDEMVLRNYGLLLWDMDRLDEAKDFMERAVNHGNEQAVENLAELRSEIRGRKRSASRQKPRSPSSRS